MIDVALVHFRAVDLRYLEAALFSLCHQSDLSQVAHLLVYDNDSADDPQAIADLVESAVAPLPPHITTEVRHDRHGDPDKRTQSYSVNRVIGTLDPLAQDWVLFTRSDYILHRDLLRDWTAVMLRADQPGNLDRQDWRGFVTSHAFHHALDARGDQRAIGFRDIEPHGWRTHRNSTDILLQKVNGWYVDTSDTDAGVWLTRRSLWREVGGLCEKLTAWGYQQTVFQKALRDAGVQMVQLPKCYFHHQHHGGDFRSYDVARAQLEAHWGTVEDLHDFRDVSGHRGAVCDELGPPKP